MDVVPSSTPEVGTEAGFRAFYEANVATVYGYLHRLTGGDRLRSEDLTQEVWCALVAELRTGRHERATIAWLLVVARSRFLDSWRRERRAARPLRLAWASDEATDPWEPSTHEVLAHLASLDPDHRVALVLRYVDDLDMVATAALMGRSVTATHSLLARARRELRVRVEGGRDA